MGYFSVNVSNLKKIGIILIWEASSLIRVPTLNILNNILNLIFRIKKLSDKKLELKLLRDPKIPSKVWATIIGP